MKRLIAFLLFSLLFFVSPSESAVQTLSGGTTYDYTASGVIKMKGTNKVFYPYLTSGSHGGDITDKIVGKIGTCASETDCSTLTWTAPFTVYDDQVNSGSVVTTWQCTDSGCPFPNRIYVFVKRLDVEGPASKDWGYVYSDDLATNGANATWSDLSIQFTASGDYTRFQVNGVPCKTATPGKYFIGAGGANSGATVGKVKLMVTTDYGVTWAQDSVELHSGVTLWTEPVCGYLGNNKLIVFARTGSSDKPKVWKSTDGGTTWNAGNGTDIGGSATNVIGMYMDDAYDQLVFMNFDRAGAGASTYLITSNNSAEFYTTAWPATTNLQTGFADNGQHSAVRVDDNHILIIWSNEISASVANIVYEIIENGTDNQYLKFE